MLRPKPLGAGDGTSHFICNVVGRRHNLVSGMQQNSSNFAIIKCVFRLNHVLLNQDKKVTMHTHDITQKTYRYSVNQDFPDCSGRNQEQAGHLMKQT